MNILLTIGFTSIKDKDYITKIGKKIEGDSHSFYPLKVGIKGFFSETGIGFYGLLEAGIVALPGLMGYNGLPKVFSPAIGFKLF